MDLAGMPGPRRLRGLTVLVFWCLAFPAWSQNTPTPTLSYVKTQFQWGLIPLEDRGLEPAFRSLAEDLMIRLSRGWKDLPERELSVADLRRLQKEALETRIRQEEKNLTEALNARDQLLFKRGGATREDYRQAEGKIRSARESLETWKASDPQVISGPVSAPLKLITESAEKTLLLPPAGSFPSWMKAKSLDVAVGGWIRSVRGYVQAEIHIWDQDRVPLATWTGWFTPDEAEAILAEVRGGLAPGLLGRQTASLTVRTQPDFTRIFIDGVMKGVGVVELPYWEPGDYILKLEGEGLESSSETVSLQSGDVVTLEREMEQLSFPPLVLNSSPPGAQVYLDSLWIGTTPLEVPVSTGRSLALLMLPGFEQGSLTLAPETGVSLDIPLEPKGTLPSIRDSKDRFYLALSIFSASFAATALLRSMELPFTQLYNQAGSAYGKGTLDMDKLNQYYTLQQTSANGGLAGTIITGALFGWLLWELSGYIGSGESAQYK